MDGHIFCTDTILNIKILISHLKELKNSRQHKNFTFKSSSCLAILLELSSDLTNCLHTYKSNDLLF